MNIVETNLQFNGLTKREHTTRIFLHHSGVNVLQTVETIHNYHKNTLGWAGIGYHFYVRKDGGIYRGRPEDVIGAHAQGDRANYDSIGICFEGNFDVEKMPKEQIESGKQLVAYLKNKYGIDRVQAHREVNSTSCPGMNFHFAEIANATTENKEPEPTPAKSIDEVAREVICGQYGNGEDRKRNLENEGYNYNEVQKRVNEIIKGVRESRKSIDELAREVINGAWGNGQDRKNRLTNAGYDYNAVQRRVNELMK